MVKKNIFMRAGRIAITITMFLSMATFGWAQRYELPDDNETLLQINAARHTHLDPEEIRIMVWNMQKGVRDSWAQDYQRLSDDKDILLLQEVLLDSRMGSALDNHNDYAYQVAASFKDTWDDHVVTGVATASSVQPVSSSWLRSTHREPVISTPKMMMLSEYALEGSEQTLLTANIHAINFVSQAKHRHMLEELESALVDHEGPMILAGDFNTWTDDKTRSLMMMVQRLGMETVDFADDHRTQVFGNKLDWVFVKGLSVSEARVHGAVTGSDHKPMEVMLSFSE